MYIIIGKSKIIEDYFKISRCAIIRAQFFNHQNTENMLTTNTLLKTIFIIDPTFSIKINFIYTF